MTKLLPYYNHIKEQNQYAQVQAHKDDDFGALTRASTNLAKANVIVETAAADDSKYWQHIISGPDNGVYNRMLDPNA
ncbi:MAG: hypothetical protein HRT47_09685 [Candidatus Caenarcaniphilales bacterium]|nr:hypothetical protein [Candidatus Caenarcaniphilales bacterium]